MRRWDGRHGVAAAQVVLQETVVGQVQLSAQVDRMLCAQRGDRLGLLAGRPAALQGLSHAADKTGGVLAQLPFPADPGQVSALPCKELMAHQGRSSRQNGPTYDAANNGPCRMHYMDP